MTGAEPEDYAVAPDKVTKFVNETLNPTLEHYNKVWSELFNANVDGAVELLHLPGNGEFSSACLDLMHEYFATFNLVIEKQQGLIKCMEHFRDAVNKASQTYVRNDEAAAESFGFTQL